MARLNLPTKALIGMVHLPALPGTPKSRLSIDEIIALAVEEARLLEGAGFHGLIVENIHDIPYLKRQVGPEITAAMTAITRAIVDAVALPVGIQILAGANREALAVAQCSGAQFIRAEGYLFASVADEGLMADADAGPLLRYRKMIGADDIAVFCDLKKKHSAHAITADVDLAEMAQAADFFDADGIIITGTSTGKATSLDDLEVAKSATTLPTWVGSGVTPDNCAALLEWADALIVGSWYKAGGRWFNRPDKTRVERMAQAFETALKGTLQTDKRA